MIVSMSSTAIVCALEEELPPEENPYSDETFYSGIGKINACILACNLVIKDNFYRPGPTKLIINFGTAGSCNPDISGLVECGTFIDRDDSFKFNSNHKVVTDANLHTISTGDNFATGKTKGCDLVDMEAYAIARVCELYNIKFKCFKYITDYTNESSYEDWKGNISDGYPLFLEKMKEYQDEL